MNNFKKIFAIVSVLLVVSFMGCKSTPKTDDAADYQTSFVEENNALLAEVDELREYAISLDAPNIAKNVYDVLEADYQELKKQVEAGEKDLTVELKELKSKYEALVAYTKALVNKNKIETMNLADYDKASYEKGLKLLAELEGVDVEKLLSLAWCEKANEADACFNTLLDTAFRALAKKVRPDTYKAKLAADAVKAYVSRTEDYEKAVKVFQQGDSDFLTKNPEGAYNNYIASREMFEKLSGEITTAREKAQTAVDNAKKRVEQSQQVALEADTTKPLVEGEAVEGIEEEDTVLLTEDDFSNESTSVEVAEDVAEVEE